MEHWNNEYTEKEIAKNVENTIYNNEEDEDDDDDDDDDDDSSIQIGSPLIKEKMSDREFRKRTTNWQRSKHQMREFTQFWTWASFLKDVPEIFTKISCINRKTYTLYDIICYSYLNLYAEKYDDVVPPILPPEERENKRKPKEQIFSMREMILTISEGEQEERKNANKIRAGANADAGENHFNSYKIKAMRKLNKYFDFILERKNSLNLFSQDGKNHVFNVFDYGFIHYLLQPEVASDIKNLTKGNLHLVSADFYYYTFVGLCVMTAYHDLGLSRETLEKIWDERFHIKYGNRQNNT